MNDRTQALEIQGPIQETPEEEMGRLGVTRVPTEYFRVGEFRYARLSDALDQARRNPRADSP